MENFENFSTLYMLRQASLTFFRLASYPVYAFEDGKVVVDRSEKTMKFQEEMGELYTLMGKVSSRVQRNMTVPKSWLKTLRVQGLAAVNAAEETKSTFREWAEHYHRSLRFLETYKA